MDRDTLIVIAVYHWIWVAFFALYAVYLAARPSCFMRVVPQFASLGLPEGEHERVMAVATRREQIEGISPRLGLFSAVASGFVALLLALTTIPVSLLYALFCLVTAGSAFAAFVQLRAGQRRIAMIVRRASHGGVPTWVFLVVGIEAFLTFLGLTNLWWPAILVTISTLAVAALAYRIQFMPAINEGRDVSVEAFVDDHLRGSRVARLLLLAAAQPMIFLSQQYETSILRWPTGHFIAEIVTFVVVGITLGIAAGHKRCKVQPAIYAGWGARPIS